jgi:GNAT superfamily N-acetyltransferase
VLSTNQSLINTKSWKQNFKIADAEQLQKQSFVHAVTTALEQDAPVVALAAPDKQYGRSEQLLPSSSSSKPIKLFIMSLYTIPSLQHLPPLRIPAGLEIKESTDAALLAILGNTTVEEVTKRLANDHVAFIAYIHNQPAAFGWMAKGKARIGELNHEFILPIGNRYLWNFRTLADYRGLGIYPALLQYIIQYEGTRASRFWIIHAPENKSSLKGIVKAGFEYVGRIYTKANGQIALEASTHSETYLDLLKEMDVHISAEDPASCWNCSSPYLKKRIPTCCCTEAETICTGNPVLSMAS